MPTTTTSTRSSNHNHHHHQRQASAGAGAQLLLVLVVVLDVRIVVVEVPATCYPVCCGIRIYACFSQGNPWYLVRRPFNMTKLSELGTALNTSRGGWTCYLGTFRDAVHFEICGAFVTHGDRRRRTHRMIRISERGSTIQSQQIKVGRAAANRCGHGDEHGASTSCTMPTCDVRRRCRTCRRREKRAF